MNTFKPMNPVDTEQRIAAAVREILEALGEDPGREGLRDTPSRVARMYGEVFAGRLQDPKLHLDTTFDAEAHDELVVVREIPFHSMCEHHLLPFFGKAHIAYLPNGRLAGLSKLARVTGTLAARPQLQERLSAQIADTLAEALQARGVLVVLEAEHMCMAMRGVRAAGSTTVTQVARGVLRDDSAARAEALRLLGY